MSFTEAKILNAKNRPVALASHTVRLIPEETPLKSIDVSEIKWEPNLTVLR